MAVPIWNPDIPAVSWVADESGLEAWQEAGIGWQAYPATVEQAQDVLGRPVPTWEHLSSADLIEVAKTLTAPPPKKTRKAKDTAPEDQPQDAAENTESETG